MPDVLKLIETRLKQYVSDQLVKAIAIALKALWSYDRGARARRLIAARSQR